jgi:hypothetical protein
MAKYRGEKNRAMVPPASRLVNVAYQIVGRFAVKSLLCQWRRVLLATHCGS